MHYKKNNIAALVTNKITIRVVLMIIIILQLFTGLLDVKCAFLQGEFRPNKKPIYMKVPKGLENEYLNNVLLKLLAPIYSLKNVAMAFWIKLVKVMKRLNCRRSLANLYLYFTLYLGNKYYYIAKLDR